MARSLQSARFLQPAGTTPAEARRCRAPTQTTVLLPQGLFQARLRFRGKLCVRYFPDFFRKFMRDRAHVFELNRVALAERAHEIMDSELNPRDQGQLFIHAQR
jgi:hypothetical protein